MAQAQLPTQTMVRTYKSADALRRDAERLAREGWTISNTVEHMPRSGCMRFCLLGGIGALVIRPKPSIVVTYTRLNPAYRPAQG